MRKGKYIFNPETLNYDKVENSAGRLLMRVLAYFTGSVVLALMYGFIFMKLVDTPEEIALRNELAQMELQYTLLNRDLKLVERVLDDLQQTDDNLYRTIFEAEPVPVSLRNSGTGGVSRYDDLRGYNYSHLVIDTKMRIDRIKRRVAVQSRSFEELVNLAAEKEDMLRSVPAIQPISNRDLTRIASGRGMRIHPIYRVARFHEGIDFTAPTGTEIYATGDAVVKEVRRARTGYGNHIILDHGFGYETLYAHLSEFNVRRGQRVTRGEVIGFVGSTGTSTAPHLHYEVKLNGRNVDPAHYFFNDLTPDEYQRLIELAARSGRTFD